jgi:periplasmic protein TonB
MMALAAEDLSDLRRWLVAGALIVAAHGGIAAAMVRWHEPDAPSEPTGAIVIEFAPIETAAPEQVEQDAVPETPIEKVEKVEEQKVEAKGEEQIEEKVEPRPPEEQPREAVQMTTPPPPELPQVAALPTAPVQGTPTKRIDSRALQTWVGEIAAVLERRKRYPATAYARGEQGIAQVSFTLDRQGRVIESHIVRSSGAPDLDEEALALLKRAEPFPPSPAQAGGNGRINLTVPIRFSLK